MQRQTRILVFLILVVGVTLPLTGCVPKKYYHGMAATNLSTLHRGMERGAVEELIGNAVMEISCQNGTIVTYVFDRGWTGCVGEGRCDPEKQGSLYAMGAAMNLFTLGLFSASQNQCITPCQKGRLIVYYKDDYGLMAVREFGAYRDRYCWGRGNKAHQGYPCTRIFEHRQPATIPPGLLVEIDPPYVCSIFSN